MRGRKTLLIDLAAKPTAVSRSWTTARSIAACTTRSPIRRASSLESSSRPRRFRTCSSPCEDRPRQTRGEISGGARRALPIEGQDRQAGKMTTLVVIDCSPGRGLLTINVLVAARRACFRLKEQSIARNIRDPAAVESRPSHSGAWRRPAPRVTLPPALTASSLELHSAATLQNLFVAHCEDRPRKLESRRGRARRALPDEGQDRQAGE